MTTSAPNAGSIRLPIRRRRATRYVRGARRRVELQPLPLDFPTERAEDGVLTLAYRTAAAEDHPRRVNRGVDVRAAEPVVGGLHGFGIPVVDWNLFDFGDGDEVAARSLRSFDAHLRGEHERGCVHLARVFLADPVPVLEHARDEARPKGHDPIQLVLIGKHDRREVPHEPDVALGFGDGLPRPSNLRLRADLPVLTPAGEGLVEPRDAESVAVPLLQRGA